MKQLLLLPALVTVLAHGWVRPVASEIPQISIDIDIKPNSINCNNPNGVITVVILSTASFDATTVNPTTVTFEAASALHNRPHKGDFDEDGLTDLMLHFRLGDTTLTCTSTDGTLSGELFDGTAIQGTDAINMFDPGAGQP